MLKSQYILPPVVGYARADKTEPRLLACGIARVSPTEGGEILFEDRSVAVAPDDPHGGDCLAAMIAIALKEPLPIVGWQILPILLLQIKSFLETISPEPSLLLSEALAACFHLGAHDPAIAMGGAIDSLVRIPAVGETGIDDFYEMLPEHQTAALRRLAKAECDALWWIMAARKGRIAESV